MSILNFGLLSPLQAALFNASDTLRFDPTISSTDVSVTSAGAVTTLSALGTSLALPSAALSTASQSGNVGFADGTLLMVGTTANDVLRGTSSTETMYGMDGNDSLAGSAGHDNLLGGTGSDTIDGGEGNDHIYGAGPTGGTDGADSLSGGAGSDYIQGNAGDDVLDGGDGSDRMLGGADQDRIFGGTGNDSINGNFGNDSIDGGDGNDYLRGGKGDDVILGGTGDDVIMGDLGQDTMTGGQGVDTFAFSGNAAAIVDTNTLLLGHVDTITDFTVGTDHIAFGFTPASVVHGVSGGTLVDALNAAQTLLTAHVGDAEVAAISVGSGGAARDLLRHLGDQGHGHRADRYGRRRLAVGALLRRGHCRTHDQDGAVRRFRDGDCGLAARTIAAGRHGGRAASAQPLDGRARQADPRHGGRAAGPAAVGAARPARHPSRPG